MNKIALSLCCLLLCAPSAFASIPEGYPPALDGQGLGKAPTSLPEIDYISPKVVPLTNQEKQALHLSGSWSRQSVEPVLAAAKWCLCMGPACPPLWLHPCRFVTWSLNPVKQSMKLWWAIQPAGWWIPDLSAPGAGPYPICLSSPWMQGLKARLWSLPTEGPTIYALFPSAPGTRPMWAFCILKP